MKRTFFVVCLTASLAAGCATHSQDAPKEKTAASPKVVAKKGSSPSKKDKVPAEASAHGRYSKLLRKIEVPGDVATYGEVNDWGYWQGSTWAGYDDLPAGYWVYVSPNWYIWAKDKRQPKGPMPVIWSPLPYGSEELWPKIRPLKPIEFPTPKPIGK